MRLLVLLIVVTAVASLPLFSDDEDNHIFGVNRMFLGMSEESQHLRKIKAMTEQKAPTPAPFIPPYKVFKNSRLVQILFNTDFVCYKPTTNTTEDGKIETVNEDFSDEVDILNIYSFNQGDYINEVTRYGQKYLIFEDNIDKMNDTRVITFEIYHRGCLTKKNTDRYAITTFEMFYNPFSPKVHEMGEVNLADTKKARFSSPSFYSRVVKGLAFSVKMFINWF